MRQFCLIFTHLCVNIVLSTSKRNIQKKNMEGIYINTKIISDYLEKNQLSISAFAKLCKVDTITLKHIFDNQIDDISIVDLKKIVKEFGCSIKDVLVL